MYAAGSEINQNCFFPAGTASQEVNAEKKDISRKQSAGIYRMMQL